MRSIHAGLVSCVLFACSARSEVVTITSVSPADATRHVPVFSPVVAQVDGALDPASIDASTAALFLGETGQAVVADVTYDDAADTVTIVPAYPLAPATDYRVELRGITAAGVAVAPSTTRFRTVENRVTERTLWPDGEGNGFTRVEHPTYDDQDRLTAVLVDANTLEEWSSFSYPTPDLVHETVQSTGGDGMSQTADDFMVRVVVSHTTKLGVDVLDLIFAPGDDGEWFTSDDPIQDEFRTSYDDSGRVQRITGLYQNGGLTADEWTGYTYGAHQIDAVHYYGSGQDHTWFDGDDVADFETRTLLDDRGGVTAILTVQCGPDLVCGTSDDVPGGDLLGRDAHGSIVSIAEHACGADLVIGTADDRFGRIETRTLDAQGNVVSTDTWDAGIDGTPKTADDVHVAHEVHDTSR